MNGLKPVLLWELSKSVLDMSIVGDTSFLAKHDLMDYSLLCGVEKGSKRLVVGCVRLFLPCCCCRRRPLFTQPLAGRQAHSL
jgi:hypothetical protein